MSAVWTRKPTLRLRVRRWALRRHDLALRDPGMPGLPVLRRELAQHLAAPQPPDERGRQGDRVAQHRETRRGDDVQEVVIAGREHVDRGDERVHPHEHSKHGLVDDGAECDGGPEGPRDMQGRQRRVLRGTVGLHHAGERGDRDGDDVVVTRQHSRRRDGIQPERQQAKQRDGDESVAVQRKRGHLLPQDHRPDDPGDGALEQDVIPGGCQCRRAVLDRPVVDQVGGRAADRCADRVDDQRIVPTSARGARPKARYIIETPEQ